MLVQGCAASYSDSVYILLAAVNVRHGTYCSCCNNQSTGANMTDSDCCANYPRDWLWLAGGDSGGGGGERVWPIRDAVVGVSHMATGRACSLLASLLGKIADAACYLL